MSRHGQEARSVSLFPFLAVLICAMGALIFLLVVTTRRIRHQAVLQVQKVTVEEIVEADFFPPVLFAAEIVEPKETAPIITKVEPATVIPEPEPRVINLAAEHEARLSALSLQKAKKLEELKLQNLNLIRLKNELNQSAGKLTETRQQIQSLQQKDEELNQKMDQVRQQRSRLAEMLQEELRTLQVKKQSQKTARSKYSVVPYDGQTGTAKRPILIECTDAGLTFIPEGVTLTPDDLKEFTPGYNPLLAGTQSLFQYWKTKEQQSNQEPYVLILVRPSGSVGYYVARKLLNNLNLDSGYELIDADWEIELPKRDPIATQICRDAVERVLNERQKLVTQLHQPHETSGPGSGGRRLQFDARTGMVRVIEPEEELGTGSGSSGQSEKLAGKGNSKSGGESRFSDVLTPRQQMTRAEHLKKVADQKHIVFKEGTEVGSSEQSGFPAGDGAGTAEQRNAAFKNLPGSRQEAEVYDLADLRKEQGGSGDKNSGLKQAKVISREQLDEMAAQHLVPLDGSREKRVADAGDQQRLAGETAPSSESRIVENPFLNDQNQTGSSQSKQQAERSQSQQSPERSASGQTASGAGNASSLSLQRSKRASAHAEIESSKNRQWQPQQSRSGIGFEREITVQVGADRIIVGEEKLINLDQGISQEELLQSMIMVMDQYVEAWGPAPRGFYWVPTIQFTVSPGGNQYYERLKSSAQKMGLQTQAKFTLDPLPVSSALSSEREN